VQLAFLLGALVAYALPIAVGLGRFGRLTSYHTWLAESTAVAMGAACSCCFSADQRCRSTWR
jgi:hypothetical protein